MPARLRLPNLTLFSLYALLLCMPSLAVAQGAARPQAATATAAQAGQPLDLNTATAAQLKTLPGIGDAYAKRIIDGRPYTAKNQLATKGIVPQVTYDKVKDLIVARRQAKP